MLLGIMPWKMSYPWQSSYSFDLFSGNVYFFQMNRQQLIGKTKVKRFEQTDLTERFYYMNLCSFFIVIVFIWYHLNVQTVQRNSWILQKSCDNWLCWIHCPRIYRYTMVPGRNFNGTHPQGQTDCPYKVNKAKFFKSKLKLT